MVRGRCTAAWTVVEYHVTRLQLLCNLQHFLITVHELLGPMLTAHHTEVFAQYGIGVEQKVESVAGVKGNLLDGAVLTAEETAADSGLGRFHLGGCGYDACGVVLQCQSG